MPEENQRITREHLPGLLLARAIWERGPSLYFPPALKTATDQARACGLEMKTHCVELYRDAPELHEVVLASEALAACAARDARIVELESGQSADMFLTLTGEITQLRAELAAIKAQEPAFMWHKGATEDESEVVDVDCACPCCVPLYAAPVSEAKAQGVVMPERANASHGSHDHQSGWNACLDEVALLNAAAPAAGGCVMDNLVLAPFQPTKEQWGGLARDIVWWMRSCPSNKHTPATLVEHLGNLGREIPAWMGSEAELRTQDHVISKGTIAVLIYKAMLAAAPAAPAADAGVNDHD